MSFGEFVRNAMDNELIEPPRGSYKTRLVEGGAFEYKDKKTGDPRMAAKVTHEILEGEHRGSRFEHFMAFYPAGIAEMNGNACAAYGVNWTEVDDYTDLDDQLDAIVKAGTTAEVSVAYKDGYMNVNVHGSRVVGGDRDIPSDTNGFTEPQSKTFAAAAEKFGDDVPFD